MLDAEEVRRLKTTANELNNLLQVILEASHYLEKIIGNNTDAQIYLKMMRMSIERSAQVTNNMFELTERAKFEIKVSAMMDGPVEKAKPLPPPQEQPFGEQIHNPAGPNELIMVVDDEQNVNLMMQGALVDQGYRVVCAKDGLEAIKIYKKLKDQIDLVILDYLMPIMDGGEVFEELRIINPRVAVVLSSGFTEHDSLKIMLAKGLRGFIPKPYSRQKLLMQVRTTLDSLKQKPVPKPLV
ncbi:MAG: response regulator [Verrucomicrobiota bacterium]